MKGCQRFFLHGCSWFSDGQNPPSRLSFIPAQRSLIPKAHEPLKAGLRALLHLKAAHPMRTPALLALEDGSVFHGHSVGARGETIGEVVFNTAMTGYQEILTDPSYSRQIVTLTYPHIGNTGTTPEDLEAPTAYAAGLVVRDLPPLASNWRTSEDLREFLTRHKVVAIAGIDTRKLTRILREKGAQAGCIMTGEKIDAAAAVRAAKKFPGLKGMDLAKVVSTKRMYQWNEGSLWQPENRPVMRAHQRLHVVAYDFGVKRNIL